jgi:hypothetical protein
LDFSNETLELEEYFGEEGPDELGVVLDDA